MSPKSSHRLAALLVASALAFAQNDDGSPTFSVDVDVVNILATVRDRDGRIVNDLSKEDFILKEKGAPQEIRYFARQTDLPLTIGLLVDTSLSQRNLIESERRGSYQFLDQVLRPEKDLAFVIKFDVDIELLQDLTNSRPLLEEALNLLEVPYSMPPRDPGRRRRYNFQGWPGAPPIPGGGGWPSGGGRSRGGRRGGGPGGGSRGGDPGGRPRGGGGRGVGTAMYDAVFLAAGEVLRRQDGRKASILISDGVDHGSRVSMYDAIESAQRADTIVYGIRYYDSDAYRSRGRRGFGGGPGSDGEEALEKIATETGGRLFEVTRKLTLDEIFERIQEELRNQYSIGYTPTGKASAEFREIKLATRNKKLKVQTRTGYYSSY